MACGLEPDVDVFQQWWWGNKASTLKSLEETRGGLGKGFLFFCLSFGLFASQSIIPTPKLSIPWSIIIPTLLPYSVQWYYSWYHDCIHILSWRELSFRLSHVGIISSAEPFVKRFPGSILELAFKFSPNFWVLSSHLSFYYQTLKVIVCKFSFKVSQNQILLKHSLHLCFIFIESWMISDWIFLYF